MVAQAALQPNIRATIIKTFNKLHEHKFLATLKLHKHKFLATINVLVGICIIQHIMVAPKTAQGVVDL